MTLTYGGDEAVTGVLLLLLPWLNEHAAPCRRAMPFAIDQGRSALAELQRGEAHVDLGSDLQLPCTFMVQSCVHTPSSRAAGLPVRDCSGA